MASTKNGVIYPDDYNKAADILADMKVLADSVDGNIEQINSNIQENTENIKLSQEEIKKLQSENIEVKAENERLRSDIGSISLIGQAEGESIDLNDSSNARFNKFEIGGNHKQETRSGKNHFFTSTSSSTTNGITYTPQADKSSIIVDGTATANATKWLIVDAAQFKLEAGSYVLSSCGTCDNSIYIGLGGKTSSGAEKFNITEKGTAVSFNINEDVYLNCYIQTVSGTQIENKLIKIMIVKAGVDYQNYESYGAMPSPDFPSEIKAVGGNVNLLNNTLQSQTINGLTVTVNDDKSVKIAGTATSNTNLVFDRHDGKLAAGTYTLKDCQTFIESTENHGWWAEGQTRTFTSEATLSKSGFYKYYSANTTVNETIYPILVKGTMATSYVQYSKGSVEVKVVNKNLYDAEKYPFVKRIAYNSKGVLSYWNGYCGIEKFFPVSENSQYVFSNSLNMPFYCIVYYDNNKNQIKVETEKKAIFTTPEKCRYVRFTIQKEEIPIWVQIKRGSTTTDFVEHQEQTITMPTQQEMLEGDYFDWNNEREVHKLEKIVLNGNEDIRIREAANSKKIFGIAVEKEPIYTSGSEFKNIYCNMAIASSRDTLFNTTTLNLISYGSANKYYNDIVFSFVETQNMTVDEFKAYVKNKYEAGTPVTVYYLLSIPTQLDFTDEQKTVAKQIKETLHTYKNVTHIYSDDEVSPIIDVEYAKDLNTVINNIQAQVINNASEEV